MPVRIYDISKKLGIENRRVLAKAKELGITAARVASSSLDKVTAARLEEALLADFGEQRAKGLRGFCLGNFKAFADTQSLPIKPLTLIFGGNSSGKSSVIHALLLAREAVKDGRLDLAKTKIGGDAVDLGGFRQYVHRREAGRQVEWAAELGPEALQGNAYAALGSLKRVKVGLFFGMPLDDKGQTRRGAGPRLVAYEIEGDGQVRMRLSRREDDTMQVDRLDMETFKPLVRALVVSATTSGSVTVEDEATIISVVEGLVPTLRFVCEGVLPEELTGQDYRGTGAGLQLVALGKEQRQEQLADAARRYIPGAIAEVVRGVNAVLRIQLDRVTYLGPLRSFPPRHLGFAEDNDPNWFAGGGYAWDIVRQDEKLRGKVNEWLGSKERLKTPYRLAVEQLFPASEVRSSLVEGFKQFAADILAPIVGQVQAAKTDPGMLMAVRDEIEYERHDVEEALAQARERASGSEAAITKVEAQLTASLMRREQAKVQREILAHTPDAGGKPEKLAELEMQVTDLQKEFEALQKSYEILKKVQAAHRKDVDRMTKRLEELQKKKADVFSELMANLDDQELVSRFYEGVQRRAERGAVDELVLMDLRSNTPVTHRDVGIGISQVLPVLVHAYADRGRIVAIEQPEIHLHPALQAELGDLFIESALGERKNTFLLETHSEHLILRVLRRVRETTERKLPEGATPVRPEDITVVFVEPTAKGSVVRHLPVTPDGDFGAPWPGGFFAERFQDLP